MRSFVLSLAVLVFTSVVSAPQTSPAEVPHLPLQGEQQPVVLLSVPISQPVAASLVSYQWRTVCRNGICYREQVKVVKPVPRVVVPKQPLVMEHEHKAEVVEEVQTPNVNCAPASSYCAPASSHRHRQRCGLFKGRLRGCKLFGRRGGCG